MNRRPITIAALILLLAAVLPTGARAAGIKPQMPLKNAAQALMEVAGKMLESPPPTTEELSTETAIRDRWRLAEAIRDLCAGYRELLPQPTDQDLEWLAAEMNSSDNARVQSAGSSPIFARSTARGMLEACATAAQGARVLGDDKMVWWLGIVGSISGMDIQSYLESGAVGTTDSDRYYIASARFLFARATSVITKTILMPMAQKLQR